MQIVLNFLCTLARSNQNSIERKSNKIKLLSLMAHSVLCCTSIYVRMSMQCEQWTANSKHMQCNLHIDMQVLVLVLVHIKFSPLRMALATQKFIWIKCVQLEIWAWSHQSLDRKRNEKEIHAISAAAANNQKKMKFEMKQSKTIKTYNDFRKCKRMTQTQTHTKMKI